jgi:hypothetical protein
MNKASESLVDIYQRQSEVSAERAKKATDPYQRGLYAGYADAFALAAEWAVKHLPVVEAEAFLLPPVEETQRERLMREEFAQ